MARSCILSSQAGLIHSRGCASIRNYDDWDSEAFVLSMKNLTGSDVRGLQDYDSVATQDWHHNQSSSIGQAFTVMLKPSRLVALATKYADLAAEYTSIIRCQHDAEDTFEAIAYTRSGSHNQCVQSQGKSSDNPIRMNAVEITRQRPTHESSIVSLLARHTPNESLPSPSLHSHAGCPSDDGMNSDTPNTAAYIGHPRPSYTSYDSARARNLTKLKSSFHQDLHDSIMLTQQDAALVESNSSCLPTSRIVSTSDRATSDEWGKESLDVNTQSSISEILPPKSINVSREETCEVQSRNEMDEDEDSKKDLPPNSVAASVVHGDIFMSSIRSGCFSSPEDFLHPGATYEDITRDCYIDACRPKEDVSRHELDSGCDANIASLTGMLSPTSSNISSRTSSGAMSIYIDSHDFDRNLDQQEQASIWALVSRHDEIKGGDEIPIAEESVRLSADEEKEMKDAIQRSIDDMTGGFDDIFVDSEGLDSGSDDSKAFEQQ